MSVIPKEAPQAKEDGEELCDKRVGGPRNVDAAGMAGGRELALVPHVKHGESTAGAVLSATRPVSERHSRRLVSKGGDAIIDPFGGTGIGERAMADRQLWGRSLGQRNRFHALSVFVVQAGTAMASRESLGNGGTKGAAPVGVHCGCIAIAESGIDIGKPAEAQWVAARQPDDMGFPPQEELRPPEVKWRDVEVDLERVGGS